MNSAIVSTYLPANGLRITTSAAALRTVFVRMGPPSWKTSSTTITRFRNSTSNMNEAPWRALGSKAGRDRRDNAYISLKRQRRTVDQSLLLQPIGDRFASIECSLNFAARQRADAARYEPISQIRIRRNLARRHAHDRRVPRQIVCVRRGLCENCGGVSNSEGKTAPAPAAGRYAANRHLRGNFEGAEERSAVRAFHHANRVALALGQVQRDIPAVVHIPASERAGAGHCCENSFSNRASDRCHGRDEIFFTKGRNGSGHDASN